VWPARLRRKSSGKLQSGRKERNAETALDYQGRRVAKPEEANRQEEGHPEK